MSLPSSIDYARELPTLPPNARATEVVVRASNGASFAPNSTLQFDLVNSGFIDPASVHIRYTYTCVNAAPASLIGAPYIAPFARSNVFFGSTQAESISQYNQVVSALSNLTLDVSQKYGLQSAYNYGAGAGVAMTIENLDGRVVAINETGTMSGHLPNILTNCDKLFPAFLAPSVRLELVMDSVASMSRLDAPLTNFTITNAELCYKMIDMGSEVEQMVRSQGDVMIRSSSFMNTSSVLALGAIGSTSLVYNQRLASIKSAFLLMSNGAANSNGWGDSFDVCNTTGQYFFTIAGTSYPQTPLSVTNNRAGVLMSLKSACGSLSDKGNSQSINAIEFNYAEGAATTLAEPSKFIPAQDLEVIDNDFLLSGVSSQNSTISAQIVLNAATTVQHNVALLLHYDAIIEISADGFASVKM